MRTILLSFSILLFSACDTKSSINFSGDRAPTISQVPAPLNPGIEANEGGNMSATTLGGYKTRLSLGARTSDVSGITSGGYKVQMNIQGQMAQ